MWTDDIQYEPHWHRRMKQAAQFGLHSMSCERSASLIPERTGLVAELNVFVVEFKRRISHSVRAQWRNSYLFQPVRVWVLPRKRSNMGALPGDPPQRKTAVKRLIENIRERRWSFFFGANE
jgi:hypothetical protein